MSQPLFSAVENGDISTVQSLLRAGADPNVRDAENVTPLMYAAQKGNIAMMEVLLDAGADIQARYKEGTVLEFAIDSHSAEVLAFLLDRGLAFNRESAGPAVF